MHNKHTFLWREERNAAFFNILEITAKIPSVYYYGFAKNSRKKAMPATATRERASNKK